MFEWIKNLFAFKVKPLINPLPEEVKEKVYSNVFSKPRVRPNSAVLDTPFTPTVQEDPRTVQSVKSVRKSFEQQAVQMQMRAMKAHAVECNDPWTCSAEPCFIREPDKIVSQETVSADRYNAIRKKNMKRIKDMNKKKQTS